MSNLKVSKFIAKSFLPLFILCGIIFLTSPAQAIDKPTIRDDAYSAKYHSQSVADPVEIEAGSIKEVTVRMKNVGSATWNASGGRYVSAYTIEPKYRQSKFSGSSWLSDAHPAKISATTKPGEVAEIKIKLYAPQDTGSYREHFFLAAENYTWIDGGWFYLDVKVVPTKTTKTQETKETEQKTSTEAEIDATTKAALTMIKSRKAYAARGGEPIDFIVVYENDSDKTWKNIEWREAGSSEDKAGGATANISDISWRSAKVINQESVSVAPGKTHRINFSFRAPREKGSYIARFQLYIEGKPISGGDFSLPVTVAQDAPGSYTSPVFSLSQSLITEPKIRVGLFKSNTPLQFQSESIYQIFVGDVKKGTLPAQSPVRLSYSEGLYTFKSDHLSFTVREPVRFVPYDMDDHFEIVSYDRTVSWKSGVNFNKYRGVLEYAYSPKSAMPYVINELLLDDYVAGIGETSNGAHKEYIKAILVAARSYAYYYISHAGENDMFNVYATTADQLYLGYNSEVVMPNVVAAARATHGEVVYYQGDPVITPYFGHSDGKTRTWTAVWGGSDKSWLQPVVCKYDAGKSMWGHGVGMSASDASERAGKDGWSYDQLLKYYYTGVEIKRLY